MNVLDFIHNNRTYLDGGLGSLLQKAGLKPGEHPEMWNIEHKDVIIEVGKNYYDAGSNIICTNTFGANCLKFSDDLLDEIIRSAIENARISATLSKTPQEKFVALDIGPLGKLLEPYGDLSFEKAVSIFSKTAKLGEKYGADLVIIETMNDCLETKCAVLGVKESTHLPVFVSNAYSSDGKLLSGTEPKAMVSMLEGLGVDAIGVNCSLGPKALVPIIKQYKRYASLPIIMKPNAGLPVCENGLTHYDVDAEEFSEVMKTVAQMGITIMGGCCGTTPEYIRLLKEKTENISFEENSKKYDTLVSSYTQAIEIGSDPVLIGERINPTGKKRFRQALIERDIPYILNEAVEQQEKGVHILDVNVGIPDIDEAELLPECVRQLQLVTPLALQIDSSDYDAIEKAMRIYNGKPLINSVNGKKESMSRIFPLVKKYGGVLIALTLDENGIPETVDGRVKIAEKILSEAEKYGIERKNIVFDPLAMAVSASSDSAIITLGALKEIKEKLHCNTCLGVSNISFGLPERNIINSTFFALAMENGLSCAIMNPYSEEMLRTYYSFRVLHNLDRNCISYIDFCSNNKTENESAKLQNEMSLSCAILKGLKEQAKAITVELLKTRAPLDIVNEEIMPALNKAGENYEKQVLYLPGLLMCAESAGSAFEEIKKAMAVAENGTSEKKKVILATVKGDIHDIGKNIVKLLLENYGFSVTDLGKDVEPQTIVETAIAEKCNVVGLSALMTTTVGKMEETVSLLKKQVPECKTIVGGAVLTKEYSEKIGASYYSKDAMATVRICEKLYKDE